MFLQAKSFRNYSNRFKIFSRLILQVHFNILLGTNSQKAIQSFLRNKLLTSVTLRDNQNYADFATTSSEICKFDINNTLNKRNFSATVTKNFKVLLYLAVKSEVLENFVSLF